MGKVCKHRMNIFYGKTTNIVEGDLSKVAELHNWYKGSVYESLNLKIKEYEKVIKKAQSKMNSEKRTLQNLMINKDFLK